MPSSLHHSRASSTSRERHPTTQSSSHHRSRATSTRRENRTTTQTSPHRRTRASSTSPDYHRNQHASRTSTSPSRANYVYTILGHYFMDQVRSKSFHFQQGRLGWIPTPPEHDNPFYRRHRLSHRCFEVKRKGKKATIEYFCVSPAPSLRAGDFDEKLFARWIREYGKHDPDYESEDVRPTRRSFRSSTFRRFAGYERL